MTDYLPKFLVAWGPLILVTCLWFMAAYYYGRKVREAKSPNLEELFCPTDCITVARRIDPTNFKRKFAVFIDEKRVGYVHTGEVVHFPTTPGQHSVAVKVDWCRSKPIVVEKQVNSNIAVWCGSSYNDWRCIFIPFFRPSDYVFVTPHV